MGSRLSHCWYVSQDASGNIGFFSPDDRTVAPLAVIEAAQPFTVRLVSFRVVNSYSTKYQNPFHRLHQKFARRGPDKSGNDVLIKSASWLGTSPRVERIHFYEDDVPFGKHRAALEYNVIFSCEDYNGSDQLWFSLEMFEIDVRENSTERRALADAFSGAAKMAGAVMPEVTAAMGFANVAFASLQKYISSLGDNDLILRENFEFVPQGGRGQYILREGTYVVFNTDVDGAQLMIPHEYSNRVYLKDGSEPDADYAVFEIERGVYPNREQILSQKVAGILTMMNQERADARVAGLQLVQAALNGQAIFQDLERYNELKAKEATTGLTAAEQERLKVLADKPSIQAFLNS